MAGHPLLFPQLPSWRHAEAQERLERSERQRQWLWSRSYLPTRLLLLQCVEPGNSCADLLAVAKAYWLYQAAAEFLRRQSGHHRGAAEQGWRLFVHHRLRLLQSNASQR